LIDAGFHHERVPLSAYSNDKGRKFWLRDGTKTTNPKTHKLFPWTFMPIPDGGIIRIKPEAFPLPDLFVPNHRQPRQLFIILNLAEIVITLIHVIVMSF
jgi:hypothetical protein